VWLAILVAMPGHRRAGAVASGVAVASFLLKVADRVGHCVADLEILHRVPTVGDPTDDGFGDMAAGENWASTSVATDDDDVS
jgi:hypothetical protein